MDWMGTWHALVGESNSDISWDQMTVRGLIVLTYGIVAVRLVGQRIFGKRNPLDIVLAVLLGSNLSRTLTGNSPLLATLIATTAIIGVYAMLLHITCRSDRLSRWLKGRALCLVHDHAVDWKTMRSHGIGEHDLLEALRAEGHQSPDTVAEAYLERYGDITILTRE